MASKGFFVSNCPNGRLQSGDPVETMKTTAAWEGLLGTTTPWVLSATTPPQCSIALWRGYVTAQFYAWDLKSGDVLLVSPTFPTWRLPWQPSVSLREDPKAVAALEKLEAELVSRDWVRIGREPGSEWYEYRFQLGRRPSSKDVAA